MTGLLDWLFVRFYDLALQPCESRGLGVWRADVLGALSGRVLEIGAGTGLNLPHYGPDVRLTLLEPLAGMRDQLTARTAGDPRVEAVLDGVAEDLPFPDASFDGVALGLVLCSVSDPPRAIAEIHRVLRPGGRVAFLEHVGARTPGLARAQRVIQPFWTVCGRGCQLTRDTEALLVAGGFAFERLSREDLPGGTSVLRPAIHGVARSV